LEVREYKNQVWKKTGHLSCSLFTGEGDEFPNASCLHPTIMVIGVKSFSCQVSACKASVWLLEQRWQPPLQAARLELSPGGHSLWVAADSLRPAAGLFP